MDSRIANAKKPDATETGRPGASGSTSRGRDMGRFWDAARTQPAVGSRTDSPSTRMANGAGVPKIPAPGRSSDRPSSTRRGSDADRILASRTDRDRDAKRSSAAKGGRTPKKSSNDSPGKKGAGRSYVVKAGDTLSEIAQRELGTAKAWKRIVDANPGLDPKRVRVGQKILLPGAGAASGSARVVDGAPAGERPAGSKDRVHVVRAGETLTGIAAARLDDGRRWREIWDLNRSSLPSSERLAVGQVLRLPK